MCFSSSNDQDRSESRLRSISIKDLKKGMYVVDRHRGEPLCPPMYSVEGYILSETEPDDLLNAGFSEAYIDTGLTMAGEELPQYICDSVLLDENGEADAAAFADRSARPTFSYAEEMEQANLLYKKGLKAAQEISSSIQSRIDINMAEIRELFIDVVDSLRRNQNALLSLAKLKDKDQYTFSHGINVSVFAVTLGKKLGVKDEYLLELGMAGFFHDIGKLFVPSDVLNFPGRLNVSQLKEIQEHPQFGRVYLDHYPNLPRLVREGALDHHERYDGHGYPKGKKGEEISLAGRLLAVADVYDAISSKRCYKAAVPPAETLSIMYKTREQDFTPGFMEAFISVIGVYPSGSLVRLTNRYLAVVVEQNEQATLRPKVVLLFDGFGARMLHPKIVDLSIHLNLSIACPMPALPEKIDVEEAVRYAR